MSEKNSKVEKIEEGEKHLTKDIQKSIEDLIYQKKSIARDQEAYKEAATAIAAKLGIKAAALNTRVALIIKEEEEGGAVKNKENDLTFVEQYFNVKTNAETSNK